MTSMYLPVEKVINLQNQLTVTPFTLAC